VASHADCLAQAPTRNGRSITLEDLATQTSGLPRLPSNFAPADAANPYADYSVKQMYDFLSSYTLRRDIGARYEYSNYGVGLLGHILTLRAGVDYEELVEERIADVLGMPDTRITITPERRSRLAIGHSGSQEVTNWDIPTLAGAGALRSTAQDMLVFLAANLDLTETPLRAALEMTREARHEAGGPRMHIGLGGHIRTGGEHEVVWHNGGTGGYRSFAGFVEETHTGVVVLTNTDMSADDIGFHMLDASIPLREIRVPVAVDPAILDQYVGRYALTPQAIVEVTVDDGKLFTQLTGQPRFQIYPESETEFFLTVVDAQLTFVRDESGKVSAVTLHQNGANLTATRLP
jgi:CubicO group peptidase (beta-lactamase class C family)